MQTQEQIVQKMIDAGEDEDNIATVIRHFKDNPAQETKPNFNNVESGSSAANTPPEEPNIAEKAYRHIFEAPEFVTKPAHELAGHIDAPSLGGSPTGEGGISDYLRGLGARTRGFAAGATEGAASLLSPANLVTLGRGKLASVAAKILGGGQVLHGAEELYHGNYARGAGDIGFGLLGLASPHGEIPQERPVAKVPEVKPTAEFLALGEDGKPIFNVSGGQSDKSTVGLDKLKELGIEAPEVPSDAVPMRGDEIRKQQQARRSAAMDRNSKGFQGPERQSLMSETGSIGDLSPTEPPAKPRYRLDRETGAGIPINEAGEQIGSAQFPGKELSPELAQLSKYNQVAKMANETQKKSLWGEVRDAQRAILTSFDFSALSRQGAPLRLTKAYWTSIDDMFKAWGSERAASAIDESIQSMPIFQKSKLPDGTLGKSIAERAGIDMGSAEQFQSNIADRLVPGVRRSERAYNGFLKKLRADHLDTMVKDAREMGLKPDTNDVVLQQIGNFINDATGKGSLGKLEKAAPILNEVFFAPRLMASRVNMYKRWLNPMTYGSNNAAVRKQALKSLISTVGFGLAAGELARLAGAQVSNDPNSSDFRKIKIGNTRIDPFSGFQQYAVGASRLLTGKSTSSTSGRTTDLTAGKYGQQTRQDIAGQFMMNKLAPIPSFVWSWMGGKDWNGKPFEVKKALLDRTVPIVMQDIADLAKEDPKLLPLAVLPIMGEGIQTYGR